MKKLAVILSLLPALATAECVLNDRTVTRVTATISERSTIRPEVVPALGGGKKDFVLPRQAHAHGIDQDVAVIAFVEIDFAAHRGHAHAIAIAANA